jgi:hypothetical protein
MKSEEREAEGEEREAESESEERRVKSEKSYGLRLRAVWLGWAVGPDLASGRERQRGPHKLRPEVAARPDTRAGPPDLATESLLNPGGTAARIAPASHPPHSLCCRPFEAENANALPPRQGWVFYGWIPWVPRRARHPQPKAAASLGLGFGSLGLGSALRCLARHSRAWLGESRFKSRLGFGRPLCVTSENNRLARNPWFSPCLMPCGAGREALAKPPYRRSRARPLAVATQSTETALIPFAN